MQQTLPASSPVPKVFPLTLTPALADSGTKNIFIGVTPSGGLFTARYSWSMLFPVIKQGTFPFEVCMCHHRDICGLLQTPTTSSTPRLELVQSPVHIWDATMGLWESWGLPSQASRYWSPRSRERFAPAASLARPPILEYQEEWHPGAHHQHHVLPLLPD